MMYRPDWDELELAWGDVVRELAEAARALLKGRGEAEHLIRLSAALALYDKTQGGASRTTSMEGEDQDAESVWRMTSYRPSFDEYFLGIAEAVRRRADCRRGQYGAVIVDDHKRIVSTGYNGSAVGGPSCLQGGCPRGLLSNEECKSFLEGNHDYSNCISLHAEVNAIAYADGDKMRNATIYVTGPPCDMCGKLIKAAGITRVVHP